MFLHSLGRQGLVWQRLRGQCGLSEVAKRRPGAVRGRRGTSQAHRGTSQALSAAKLPGMERFARRAPPR